MISYIEAKVPDFEFIREALAESERENWWSNFGPVSLRLEGEIRRLLEIGPEKAVVACSNATVALHGLVNMYSFVAKRQLKWVVSAYTFRCQLQGPLSSARVVDCDRRGFLDLDRLSKVGLEDYDGIIVTNLFGKAAKVSDYIEFAKQRKKLLVFDSASCFYSKAGSTYLGGFGDAEVFSFHHTKPCGFGEGGGVVVDREHEDIFRSMMNFGSYKKQDTGALSMNGKMSDVAAAFIMDRLRRVDTVKRAHQRQFLRVEEAARRAGCRTLFDLDSDKEFPGVVPILGKGSIDASRLPNRYVMLHKYYQPLGKGHPSAEEIYDRIVLFPCHPDIASLSDLEIRDVIEEVVGR